MEEQGIRYCERCRETVPLSEWRPSWPEIGGVTWHHVGEMRGVISWDSESDDRSCGFAFHRSLEESR